MLARLSLKVPLVPSSFLAACSLLLQVVFISLSTGVCAVCYDFRNRTYTVIPLA